MLVTKAARDGLVAVVVAAMGPAGGGISALPAAFIQHVCGSLAKDADRPQGALCALSLLHFYRRAPVVARAVLTQHGAWSARQPFSSGRTWASQGCVSTGTNGVVFGEAEEAAAGAPQSVLAQFAHAGMGSQQLSPSNSYGRSNLGSRMGGMQSSMGLSDEPPEHFDVDACLKEHIPKFAPAICAKLTRLRSLSFSGLTSLEDEHLAGIASLSGLVRLSLRHCSALKDEGLALISALSQLQRLDLSHCTGISPGGLTVLLMPSQESDTAHHGLADFKQQPRTASAGTAGDHRHTCRFPHLISLRLQGMPAVTPRSMHAVAESYCHSLQVLDVSSCAGVWRAGEPGMHEAPEGGALCSIGMLRSLHTLSISLQHTVKMALRHPKSGRVAVDVTMPDGDDKQALTVKRQVMSFMESVATQVGWELLPVNESSLHTQSSVTSQSHARQGLGTAFHGGAVEATTGPSLHSSAASIDAQPTQALLAPLATLSALTSLTLCDARSLQYLFPGVLSVADCCVLGSLPALASLDLSVSVLSREHMQGLCPLSTLHTLNLRKCSLHPFEGETMCGGRPRRHTHRTDPASPTALTLCDVSGGASASNNSSTSTTNEVVHVESTGTNGGVQGRGQMGTAVPASHIGPAMLTSLTLDSCKRVPESFWREWVTQLPRLASLTVAPYTEPQGLPGLLGPSISSCVGDMHGLTLLDLSGNVAVTEEIFSWLQVLLPRPLSMCHCLARLCLPGLACLPAASAWQWFE